jgi:hypothetical protein
MNGAPDAARRPRWLEPGALALALAIAACSMGPVRGYLTDDTFIHLHYARHLAQGLGPVFNAGERVYGCTSPLWIALIALGIKLGADGLLVAKALGAAATLAAVVLFHLIARRTLDRPWLSAGATVVWAAHAWMIRWSVSGMETPLATALVLAGFASLTATRPWGERRALTGAWWGLAALARPEALLLLAAWGAAQLVSWRREPASAEAPPLARRAAAMLPAVLIVGAWLGFALAYFGTPWPQTLSAKAAGSGGLAGLIDNLRRIAPIVLASDGVLCALLIAGLATRRPAPAAGEGRVMSLLPWAWALGVPLLYVARGVPVLSRYLVPALPVLGWLAWRAAARSQLARTPGRARALAIAVTVLALAENAVVYRALVLPQVTSFTRGMEQSLIPLGRWLHDHAAHDASVATPDIGAIGYFSGLHVVDLGGLVTPRMVPLLERAPFEDVLAHLDFAGFTRPEFVLDRGDRARDLLRRSPYAAALAPLDSASVPNLGIRHPGPVVYTLYRVDWQRFDALRGKTLMHNRAGE